MSAEIQAEATPLAPGAAFSGDRPLIAVLRGQWVGSLHRGTFVVARADGTIVASLGDATERVFLRSAAKPFQIMPAILAGGIERFGISETELAVLCASHSGEARHLEAVGSVLAKIGLDESALQCGVHAPLNEHSARSRNRLGLDPSPVCNNCSGAHTGMLVACRANSWPIVQYGAADHPLQRETRSILARFSGLEAAAIDLAVDNCHVPTFRLPITEAAVAFARLATGKGVDADLRRAAELVVRAMTAHPEMVAGEDRFDTDLMVATDGRLVSKGGAEGFQGVGLLAAGVGVALKVTDGNSRAVGPAVIHLLKQLDLLTTEEIERLAAWRRPITRDLKGTVNGSLIPVFSLVTGT